MPYWAKMRQATLLVLLSVFIAAIVAFWVTQSSPTGNFTQSEQSPAALPELHWHPSPIEVPPVTFKDEDSQDISLSHFLGTPVLLNLWATWCAPCRKGLPHIEQVVASDPEVSGVLISLDGPEDGHKIEPFLKGLGVGTPTLWDKFRTIAQRHGLGGETIAIPKTFVLDGNGVVRAIFEEEGADFPARLEAAVTEAKKAGG